MRRKGIGGYGWAIWRPHEVIVVRCPCGRSVEYHPRAFCSVGIGAQTYFRSLDLLGHIPLQDCVELILCDYT